MSTTVQEVTPKSEPDALLPVNESGAENTETTQIYRRDDTPTATPKERTKTTKPKVQETMKKKSNSGIPLRLKNAPINNKNPEKKTYRHPQSASTSPGINKNTLEVQFMNNKKRLLQLHAELVEKQRPLIDMHKSLVRTKKQLETLGKKVVLDDLKVISLKSDEKTVQPLDGAGENPAIDTTAMNLKSSIDNVLDSCAKVCEKCIGKRDDVVKMLESASKADDPDHVSFDAELQDLRKEQVELEKFIHDTFNENQKKIEELIANWQKATKNRNFDDELTAKITALEETIKQQQKNLSDAEENSHSLNRRFEDKKATFEKTQAEWQEKYNKLEEELKKEHKIANDNLMKSRTLRAKVTEIEMKFKEADEKATENATKFKQLQEQMRKKEIQWLKEKDDFKKNEALLQQKFNEKQSQFDTRLKELEETIKMNEKEQENNYRSYETQLEIKDQELQHFDRERELLSQKTQSMEEEIEELKKQLVIKDQTIDELSMKADSVPAIEYKQTESQWLEIVEYKDKIELLENHLKEHKEQISKMHSSLRAHAQLAAALKMEKDNAFRYSDKLKEVLKAAQEELEGKTKLIYKVHEKLVLRESECEQLKAELKDYEAYHWGKNRCQICRSNISKEKQQPPSDCSTYMESDVGKTNFRQSQFVSESLIGMSVKKVDHLRARLDNLKKIKLPTYSGLVGSRKLRLNYSWSNQSWEQPKNINNHLRKQIELREKLYKILQKHADQSCEDLINVLKMTVSNCGRSKELKPSNSTNLSAKQRSSSQIKITKSFISKFYDVASIHENFIEHEDELSSY